MQEIHAALCGIIVLCVLNSGFMLTSEA